jgi:hypothetical protein
MSDPFTLNVGIFGPSGMTYGVPLLEAPENPLMETGP